MISSKGRSRRAIATCYMCDAPATGREHTPPSGFFPPADLSGGLDLRRNLITVPACDKHNTGKSKNDELVRLVVCGTIGTNDIGHAVMRGPVMRGIKERPALGMSLLRNSDPAWVCDPQSQEWHRTALASIDEERIYSELEMMGRALHFHHFNRKWLGDVRAIPDFFEFRNDSVSNRVRSDWRQCLRDLDYAFRVKEWPRHGENRRAFYYQVITDEATGRCMIKACFYEGPCIFLAFGMGGMTNAGDV